MYNDWTCSSNEALKLTLARAPEDYNENEPANTVFSPSFTYPIYGEDEKIYGYKGLVLDLRFASGSLAPYFSVKHKALLPSSSTVDDVEGMLQEFLPADIDRDESTWQNKVLQDAESFKPVGDVIYAYTKPGEGGNDSAEKRHFEVYRTTWDTPRFKELHRRMQLFALLYIEGGSYINEEEDQWEFAVLYEKRKRRTSDMTTYHFVGYSSLYRFFSFPDRVRLRLSQFIILPPYQRQGHGSELYTGIYRHALASADVAELTVEDPAEAFEDLRDIIDLRMLLANPAFMGEAFGDYGGIAGDSHLEVKENDLANESHGGGKVAKTTSVRNARTSKTMTKSQPREGRGKMGPPTDKAWAEKWRLDLKLAGRQYSRLLEMLMLLRLQPDDAKSMRTYRLQVKERLYRFNFDALVHLEKPDRLEKLQETFDSLTEDYVRRLALAGCK